MKANIYICNNFSGNKVHSEMINKLSDDNFDINHIVFVPYSDDSVYGNNVFDKQNVIIEYIYVYKYLKFFPILKSLFVLFLILKKGRFYKLDWKKSSSLAYTFWSDGVLAFYLYLIYKTPYSVFLRITDISVFFKYGYHLRPFFYFIANNAQLINFPSLILKKKACTYSFLKNNVKKFIFLPNPLNEFWIENAFHFDNLAKLEKKIIFVGTFNHNKNLKSIFHAVKILKQSRSDFSVEFIGGTELEFSQLCEVDSIPDWIVVTNSLPKDKLLYKYRAANILLVPSFMETFGMVYIEAISQGCIAICSKNQGVDGLFEHTKILHAVDPYNIDDIKNKINVLLDSNVVLSNADLIALLKPFSSESLTSMYNRNFNN